jgi:hypothetical protein
MDMLPSKASEGDFIRNGLVSEDFTLSDLLFQQGMIVPNRLKVRLEAFRKSIPMSVWAKSYAISGLNRPNLVWVLNNEDQQTVCQISGQTTDSVFVKRILRLAGFD